MHSTKNRGHDATTRICLALAQVPVGRVVTYGGLAELAGLPRAARLVGQTLRRLPRDTRLPWHRVINAQGKISLPEPAAQRQWTLLREEGVTPVKGKVDLSHYGWPKPGEL
ncbi:MGMT family protein [Microbulbifer salipaludis]|uniref:MGMT family protein n=1 Tax=Microbulbifer salipaludis TaxID=187980 RepID=A0ABS3EA53_9GAMM|nr:MGMT family protein [Microbulbifer salipaludis]MBN8432180.1 MGMT family protein [Microbulbifer salipaludis]